MPNVAGVDGERRRFPWRLLGWGGAAALLLAPAIAMQFTREVNWTAFDFVVAGALIAATGMAIELAMHGASNLWHRAAGLVMIGAVFLLIWVNLAVGFLGSETNAANLVFFSVLAVVLLGSILTRFQPKGMALTMALTAALQAAIGLFAIAAGWASPGPQGVFEVTMGAGMFVTLWLAAGALFWKAARG